MIKIEIKNRFTGSIIFGYSKENNTIKDTLKEYISQELKKGKTSADLRYADLRYANLRYADLRYANLTSADLRYADLTSANLRYADLTSADLTSANLTSADLRYADLTSANLTSANLRYADLTSANLRYADLTSANLTSANLRYAENKELSYLPIFCKWSHSILGDKIKIGCKEKTIKEWDLFFNSDEVIETERNTQDFKQIQSVYLSYKAYLTHLNS